MITHFKLDTMAFIAIAGVTVIELASMILLLIFSPQGSVKDMMVTRGNNGGSLRSDLLSKGAEKGLCHGVYGRCHVNQKYDLATQMENILPSSGVCTYR